jgi:hypothetical protein
VVSTTSSFTEVIVSPKKLWAFRNSDITANVPLLRIADHLQLRTSSLHQAFDSLSSLSVSSPTLNTTSLGDLSALSTIYTTSAPTGPPAKTAPGIPYPSYVATTTTTAVTMLSTPIKNTKKGYMAQVSGPNYAALNQKQLTIRPASSPPPLEQQVQQLLTLAQENFPSIHHRCLLHHFGIPPPAKQPQTSNRTLQTVGTPPRVAPKYSHQYQKRISSPDEAGHAPALRKQQPRKARYEPQGSVGKKIVSERYAQVHENVQKGISPVTWSPSAAVQTTPRRSQNPIDVSSSLISVSPIRCSTE